MEYPLQIELNVTQDDFIAVEILEQDIEKDLAKKSYKKTFIIETIIMAFAAAFVLYASLKGFIVIQTMIFVIGAYVCLAANSLYHYFKGCDREFSMAVQHILENKDTHEFFTAERGMILFFENRCEYLTNEQRRFFDYDKIKNIKITRHLFIFVMKRTKDKNLRGFAYMVIPKRNLVDDQLDQLTEICNGIIEKYNLEPWTNSQVIG